MRKSDISKVHDRIDDIKERVVNLEAQRPHIDAALIRIEKSVEGLAAIVQRNVDRITGWLSKGVFIVLALFITALWKLVVGGGSIPGVSP